MAPTEQSILSSFLLRPAPLSQILTLQTFTSLFPSSARSSPEIKHLYRVLQNQRAKTVDAISANIDHEVKRGEAQRKTVIRNRRDEEDGVDNEDEEISIEKSLYGQTSSLPSARPHTLESILKAMDVATDDVQAEVLELEREAEGLLADITASISGLSDLRYGRFSDGQITEHVLQGIEELENICENR